MRTIALGAAILAALTVAAGAARADSSLDCDAYATKAIAQQKENQSLRCGFVGHAWTADVQAHRSWCQLPEVHMANLVLEDNARTEALLACQQQTAACDQYAALAHEQNQAAEGCGFSGARWHDDVDQHRAWCMTAAPAAVLAEAVARNKAILDCDTRLANISLQDTAQRMNQILEMLSAASKRLHDSEMSFIRKIGK